MNPRPHGPAEDPPDDDRYTPSVGEGLFDGVLPTADQLTIIYQEIYNGQPDDEDPFSESGVWPQDS